MSNISEEHNGRIRIGSRTITSLWFADDSDALAEKQLELKALVKSRGKTCRRSKMENDLSQNSLHISSRVLWSWRFSFRGSHLQCYIACELALRETSHCQTDIWVTEEFFCEFSHQNAFQAGR